jgi:nucleoside-triphosphatase THEP1
LIFSTLKRAYFHYLRNMIFLLTGESGSGKTTLLNELAEIFSRNGFICGGFTAPGTWLNGKRSGFILHDINHNIDLPLAETGHTGTETQGRFVFDRHTLDYGNRLLLDQIYNPETDFLIIDEVGPLEIKDMGWAPSLEIASLSVKPQLWVVRPGLTDSVQEKWEFTPTAVFSVSTHNAGSVFRDISGICSSLKR